MSASVYFDGPYFVEVHSNRRTQKGRVLPDRFFVCHLVNGYTQFAEFDTLEAAERAEALFNQEWDAAQDS